MVCYATCTDLRMLTRKQDLDLRRFKISILSHEKPYLTHIPQLPLLESPRSWSEAQNIRRELDTTKISYHHNSVGVFCN